MKTALAVLALSTALSACAVPPPAPSPMAAAAPGPGGRQCFWASSVRNFREVGDEAVLVRVNANEIFRLDFQGRCPGIRWNSSAIGLQQRGGGGGAICDGLDVDVVTRDNTVIPRCPVRSVRRLSEAEVAALPDNQRP